MSDVLATPPSRRERDERDFRALFTVAYPDVLAEVDGLVHDQAIAGTIARESFVRLLQRWRWVRRLSSPEAWVRRDAIRRASRRVREPSPVLDPKAALESVIAAARHRATRLNLATAAVVATSSVALGVGIAMDGSPTSNEPPRVAPLRTPSSTAPQPARLGPPPWVTGWSLPVATLDSVYTPSPMDGHWISPPLSRDRVRKLAGEDLPPGPLRLRLVVRSTVLALWVGHRNRPEQSLVTYESFAIAGDRVTLSPVGHSTSHATYRWRVVGDELRLVFVSTNQSREDRRGLRALFTSSPFLKRM